MHFHKRLLKIRKEQSYTQQSLVDTVGIQVTHIKEEDQLLQFEAISLFTPEKNENCQGSAGVPDSQALLQPLLGNRIV